MITLQKNLMPNDPGAWQDQEAFTTPTKTAGLVKIGEFGFSNGETGTLYATRENVAAVRAEWNEIDEDDASRAAIQPAITAGGIWIPDAK